MDMGSGLSRRSHPQRLRVRIPRLVGDRTTAGRARFAGGDRLDDADVYSFESIRNYLGALGDFLQGLMMPARCRADYSPAASVSGMAHRHTAST